jgi:hypothetical protein
MDFSSGISFTSLNPASQQCKVESVFKISTDSVNHFRKIPEWLKGRLSKFRERFNYSRFHRVTKVFQASLCECNVRKLT